MQAEYQDGSDNGSGYLRVSYRFGEAAFEAEGTPDDVNRHTAVFLTEVKGGSARVFGFDDLKIESGKNDVPMLPDTDTSIQTQKNDAVHGDVSLVSFYMETFFDPSTGETNSSQHEQLLFITSCFETKRAQQVVLPTDYTAAYDELSEVPVKKPGNTSARLGELVEQGLLRKVGKGYGLTVKGRQAVAKIGHR